MFRKFAGGKGEARKSEAVAKKSEPMTIKGRKYDYYVAPKYQFPVGTPNPWGGVNLEGGLVWGNGMFLGVDVSVGLSRRGVDSTYYEMPSGNYSFEADHLYGLFGVRYKFRQCI